MAESHQESWETSASLNCRTETSIRAAIQRLQTDLAARRGEQRPLPSSVVRAYQAMLDKCYQQLKALETVKFKP